MQSTRAKQKVTDQKIQQVEEAFSHAKQLYDEITDELYEELPAFYDRYGVVKLQLENEKVGGVSGWS